MTLPQQSEHTNNKLGEFPGCPVVKSLQFHRRGMGSVPNRGTKISYAVWKNK